VCLHYIDGVNLFVDVRYDQERNVIACLFQNQPLDTIKECAVFKTGRQPKRRFGYSTSFVAINNTFLNTNCFKEVRVEARSGVHTPVSVIIDAKEGPCPKATNHSKFLHISVYNAILATQPWCNTQIFVHHAGIVMIIVSVGGGGVAIIIVAVCIVPIILCSIAGRKCKFRKAQAVPDSNLKSIFPVEEGCPK
jgi:hypothetical protein